MEANTISRSKAEELSHTDEYDGTAPYSISYECVGCRHGGYYPSHDDRGGTGNVIENPEDVCDGCGKYLPYEITEVTFGNKVVVED